MLTLPKGLIGVLVTPLWTHTYPNSVGVPHKQVMSSSGVKCIVALTDQWYLTYREEERHKLTE